MKLHLPSGLRKALMACLAAVAFALPSTLSSASLPAGALISFVLAQQVTMAADFGPEEWPENGAENLYVDSSETQTMNVDLDSSDKSWSGKEYFDWTKAAGYAYEFYNTSSTTFKGLKLTKFKFGGSAKLVLDEGHELHLENLWLSRSSNGEGNTNYFQVQSAGFFAHIDNLWINDTALVESDNDVDITGIATNLHLGGATHVTTKALPGSNYADDHVVFWMKKQFVTSGYLDVVEDTRIVLESGTTESTLSVSNMQGSGDLIIGTVSNSRGTLKITGNMGGEETPSYTGVLSFDNVKLTSGVNQLAIVLSNGVTFDVKGLKTENEHAGASFTVESGEEPPTATVKISNKGDSEGTTAANMQFGEGVTLQIESNAVQTFTGTSSVSKLTGKGNLTVGGTFTLGALSSYEGTITALADTKFYWVGGGEEARSVDLSKGYNFTASGITYGVASGKLTLTNLSSSGGALSLYAGEGAELTLGAESENITVSGMLRLEGSGSYNGSITFTPEYSGKLYVGAGADVSKLSLKFQVTGVGDDPFWSVELADGSGKPSVTAWTVDGMGRGQALGWSGNRLVLESPTNMGGDPIGGQPFTGPTLSDGKSWSSATSPEGDSRTYALTGDSGDLYWLNLPASASSEQACTITDGGPNTQVVINVVKNGDTILGSSTSITAKDVWVRHSATGKDGEALENAVSANFYLRVDSATAFSSVSNLYVSDCGVLFNVAYNGEVNLFLGRGADGYYNNSTSALRSFTLSNGRVFTTTGSMTIVDDAQVVMDGANITVGSLTGSGDLMVSVTKHGTVGHLIITGTSESYKGHINFDRSYKAGTTIELGSAGSAAFTLTTAGILSGTAGDGNVRGGKILLGTGATSATVRVLGSNPGAAEGITIGTGVTLEIAQGASQMFGDQTSVSKLRGAGALGVSGSVTVTDVDEFTGEVHLVGNGTAAEGTLNVGSSGGAAQGITFSKVVLRRGGGTLNVGGKSWTITEFAVKDGPESAFSGLTLGALENVQNASIHFGGGQKESAANLGKDITLHLRSGLSYSGYLKLDLSTGDVAPQGARLTAEAGVGASLLSGDERDRKTSSLHIILAGITYTSTKDALEWKGVQLFNEGQTESDLEGLMKSIEVAEGSTTPAGLRLEITADGYIHFVRETAADLTWKGGVEAIWEDHGATEWTNKTGSADIFTTHDNVTFDSAASGLTSGTVTLGGDITAGNVTIKGTFSGEDRATSGWTFGSNDTSAKTLTITGNLALDGNTQALFDEHVSVKLNSAQEGGISITGAGDVTFGAIQGNDAGITIGDGNTATTVHFTDKGADTTMRHFGAVEVKGESKLIIDFIQGNDAWGNKASTTLIGGDYVCGDGTVVLRGGGAVVSYGGQYSILRRLFNSAGADKVLDTLEIENVTLSLMNDCALNGVLEKHLKKFVVKEGSTLSLASNKAGFTDKGEGLSNTLYLAGGTLAVTSIVSPSIGWDIVVSQDATIQTEDGGNDLNITGTLKLSDDNGTARTLTKMGSHALNIGTMVGVSDTDKDKAGSFDIRAGTVYIQALAEPGSNNYVAENVTLANENTHFKLGGGGSASYTVGRITFGGTNEGHSDTISPTAYVDLVSASGTAPTLSVDTLELQKNGRITGVGGTLKVTGSVTGGLNLRVQGAALDVSAATTKSMTGGLYLYNSAALKIGGVWSLAFLGGSEASDGVSYGARITTDGASAVLTLTGDKGADGTVTPHIVYNLTIGADITLELAENTSQNFRHLTSEGTLELKSGASTTFMGRSTANVGNSTGSITNEGSIQVGGSAGSQGGELTVNGDLSSSGTGSVSVGVAGEQWNINLLTVNGNIEHNSTGNISVENNRSTLTVTGTITGTGTGTLLLQDGKLNVQGGGAVNAGYKGMLNLQGASVLTLGNGSGAAGYLTVAGLQNETNQTGQQTITGNGTLELNVTGAVSGAGMNIQLEGSTTLKKSGTGTQKLSRLSTSGADAKVHVTDGTLQIVAPGQGEAALSVGNLIVEGGGGKNAKLDLAVGGLAASGTNITLSNGGTLSNSATGATGGNSHSFNFGKLTLGGGEAKLELGDYQSYNFTGLTAVADFTLSVGDGTSLLGAGTGRTISLGTLESFSGTISGKVAEGNHLHIDGAISTGGGDGNINLTGGAVELRSDGGGVLKKTGGTGVMTISNLKLTSGQGLGMTYGGEGALTIGETGHEGKGFEFEGGVRLVYDNATCKGKESGLVTLKIEDIFTTLENLGGGNYLTIETQGINPDEVESIYLGIISEDNQTDLGATYSASKLQQYFEGEFTFDGSTTTVSEVDLAWEWDGAKCWLKATLLNAEEAHRYWDENWDEPGVTPYNKDMVAHGDAWYKAPAGEEEASGFWSEEEWQTKDRDAENFARVTLDLSGEKRETWNHNNTLSLRLDVGSGSSKDDTLLTIIGGKLDNDSESAGTKTDVSGGVYLSLWANEADHFHMLVGGSAFKATNGTAGSFSGNTHIQVQGGTVDYLIGGNHLSSGGATFAGNTYISVYEGGKLRDPDTGKLGEELQASMRSVVRGGIVGGSTITMSNATGAVGDGATVDFKGRTHINIYTVLQTHSNMPSIDDENEEIRFSHIVGGNAWVTVPSRTESGDLSPTFYGSTDISIDLRGYQGKYTGQSPTGYDEYDFLKGIVGGNYSAGGNAEGGARNTVFRYNSDVADKHPYGSHIVIFGHSDFGEGHDITFHAGVNGASRRDTSGRGKTTYEGDTLVEIHGGTFANYVAGGFWFGGATQDDSSHQVTPIKDSVNEAELVGDTAVELEISDEEGASDENAVGTYWRVVGGSVNRFSAEGSGGTHSGDSSLTIGEGSFGALNGAVGIAAGGSYYEESHGTYTQTGAQTLTVDGGVFTGTRLVGGDYAVLNGAGTSLTLDGSTNVTISDGATVTGIVIGGGYMEDEGTGGSLTITGSTNITIEGGTISAKTTDFNSTTGSDRLAIVAGSMLVDTGTSGGHTLEIGGGTNLTIIGGTINGYVVGGSYSSSTSDGTKGNSIILGESINVELNGGTIIGNVFGGHYSDNTDLPSSLALGNVKITLAGTNLEGYIFGGSYRRAQKAADTTPTQGAIEIELKSGSVAGGVYAAGNHLLVGKDANLRERTASTKIVLTGDVTIGNSTFAQAGSQIILSGGYQRGLKSDMGGTDGYTTDYSTVGYNEESKSWNENAAVLEFSNKGEDDDFSRLQDLEALYLQDLDTIDVNEGLDVKLENAHMRVMHKVTKDASGKLVRGKDAFTKGGQGNLTLGTLWSWHAQETGDGAYGGKQEAYTGKIILGGGTLTLTGGGTYEQSLEGGLMINMNGRPSGNADQAYLKGEGGTRFTGLGHGRGEDGKIDLELVSKEFELGEDTGLKLATGVYYLVDGLNLDDIDLKEKTIGEYFNLHGLKELVDASLKLETQLAIRDGDKLVLRIFKYDTSEWRWDGSAGKENVWKNDGNTFNWTKNEGKDEEAADYEDNLTYYFDAGAEYGGDIFLESGIKAGNIIVEGGEFTFKLEGGTGLTVDTIQVGISNPEDPGYDNSAELTLAMSTKKVGKVQLEKGGVLTLANDKAIQKNTTQIVFNGGTLAYGEEILPGDGFKDLWKQVNYKDSSGNLNSTGNLRIRVGNEDGEVDNDPKHGVTWSGGVSREGTAKTGIDLAVEKGIVKSGRLNFTLDWKVTADPENNFAGTLEAEGGVLTLKANGGKVTIQDGNELKAAEGATVELIASGAGSSLTVERAASGEGTIAIGSSREGAQGDYKLDAAVDGGFTGTIRLAGDGGTSVVTVNDVHALGRVAEVDTEEEEQDSGSTLALAGRAIKLAKGVSDPVEVQKITVEGTNYVGGYSSPTGEDDPNKTITLSAAGGITGGENAVLANAKGGYAQTLEGDLSEYKGAIVAGFGTDKVTEGQSTWTLKGELKDGSATIAAKLAGSGQIIVSYGDPANTAAETGDSMKVTKTVRLTGVIGDATMGTHVDIVNGMGADSAVVLANTNVTNAAGSLIFHDNEIWLGDELGSGSWSGDTLALDDGAQNGTFRLRNGHLSKPDGIITKGEGVRLIVDTAENAEVYVGNRRGKEGTKGSLFDAININAGGKLRDVTGDITVGEGKTGMHLIFTENNIGTGTGSESNYLIGTKKISDEEGSKGKLVVNNTIEDHKETGEKDVYFSFDFSFDLTNKALFTLLMDTRQRELQAMEEEGADGKKELLDNRDSNTPTYLHLLTSDYTPGKDDDFNLISFADGSDEALNKLLRSGTYTGLLEGVGFTMSVDGGDLVLLGSSLDIYIVLNPNADYYKYGQGDKDKITSQEDADLLSGKKATLLDEETTLTLDLNKVKGEEEDVEVTVNNLVGLSGSALEATGEGTVVLNNAEVKPDPMEDDKWLDHVIDDQEHLGELKGQDTEFEGTIRGGEGVTFQKKGAGTLTVGNGTSTSGLQIEGTLKLTNGSVVVRSKESNLDTLTFDYGKDATVGKGLVVDGGAIYVDHIEEGEDATGKVTLSNGGTFIYKGTMTDDEEAEGADKPLVSTTFTTEEGGGTLQVGTDTENATLILGSDSEKGTSASIGGDADIVVNDGSTLKLQDQATMDAGQVELAGRLDMSGLTANPDATNTASALSGEGTLKGGELTQLTIDGQPDTVDGRPTSAKKAFSGTLDGAGTLSVAKDAAVYFDGLNTKAPEEGGNKWNLDIESGATLDVKLEKDRTADLGNVTLEGDSNFVFHCNTAAGVANYATETGFAGALKVDGGDTARANLTVDLNGWAPEEDKTSAFDDYKIKLGGLTWDEETNGSKSIADRFNDPKITGRGAQYFSGSIITGPGNVVFVELDHQEQNMYKHANQEKNAAAGADIFWGIDDPTTDAGKHLDEDGDLYEFTYALGDKYQTSGAGSELDRMLAAGAGASIAVLGQALGDDLHRQLNSLRNRTTGMGSEARYDQYDMLPLYHMWVNGETGYHKLDADGLAPGYTLNSWGGTLGMEIDVSRRVTVGLALTAMYGDLKTDATDSASGDMDTTYMSAFVRGTHGAWSHTLVVTGGMADVKFNRTVGYDAPTSFGITMPASYKTSGSTDGYMVGAIYELGYTRLANASGTVAIQPVFNVEIRHVGIQGYNETGSDAGLRVGDITQDTVTIGLGARVQALTGTNIFNRSAIFEGRALLKADVGDRSGKVVNAVLNTRNSAELESAEVGAVGVEIGAGISIPLGGTEGSIFIDGSLEWRSGYTSMDATIGYRVNF